MTVLKFFCQEKSYLHTLRIKTCYREQQNLKMYTIKIAINDNVKISIICSGWLKIMSKSCCFFREIHGSHYKSQGHASPSPEAKWHCFQQDES